MATTLDFSSDGAGDIFFEDDGIPGNATGRFRHGTGGFATFAQPYPADALILRYAAGQVALLNLFDPLAAANLTVGNLANAAQNPDAIKVRKVEQAGIVTLSTTGAITEWGNDLDADILAGSLALAAATGVGTAANALDTEGVNLEAETNTGGINVRHIGNVDIGDASADLAGLAGGTSGNINLEVHGAIRLTDTDGFATINGGTASGNVTVNAVGAGSFITSTVNHGAVFAIRGSISLNAGSDITFGTGAGFDSDVRADGKVTITAGGLFRVAGSAQVVADAFGHATGGGLAITAGAGIFVDNGALLLAAGAGGGNVILTAGVNSLLSLTAPVASAVASSSGDVIANADRVSIASDSGIIANTGMVTIRPQTAGRAIDLGSAGDPASRLALSDAELDRVITPTLVIGGSTAGAVTVTSGIAPLLAQDLTIQSGSDITVNAGTFLSAPDDLTLKAGDDITLIAGAGLAYGGTFTGHVDVGNADPGEGGTAFVDAGLSTAVRFFGGNDSDTLMGGLLDDWLDGSAGADTMLGRLGDDIYVVDSAGDITAETVGQGIDTVRATVNHTLQANVDILTLLGNAGLDGDGNGNANTLNGNGGDNTLSGLGNADTLLGNAGDDTLQGGDGTDTLNGGAGNDTLNGGNQTDTASYAGAAGAITVSLSVAGAQATGGSGSDTLSNVENLTGSSHADTLTGDALVNILTGGNGNDTLNGLSGNDTLLGEVGADTLVGGTGRDLMTGGANNDTFDFNDIGETGTTGGTRDQIIDFVQGTDKIDLATIDARTLADGNQAFAFIGAAAFSGVEGQLRAVTNATMTIVQGDVNGDGTGDFQIQLNTVVALAAADFAL